VEISITCLEGADKSGGADPLIKILLIFYIRGINLRIDYKTEKVRNAISQHGLVP